MIQKCRVSKERMLGRGGGAQFSTTGLPSESLGPTLCKREESAAISQVNETQPLSMASQPLRAEGDTQRNFMTQGLPIKGPQPKHRAFKGKTKSIQGGSEPTFRKAL